MTKEMIISSNGHETIVAILEDDLVAEIFVERERQRGVAGNVYKGRVSKVLPGMQSSFIDIGLERDGFLYVADVIDTLEEFEKLESGEDDGDGQKRSDPRDRPPQKIEELLREGQEILVQVVKEPLGTKGARLTSHEGMSFEGEETDMFGHRKLGGIGDRIGAALRESSAKYNNGRRIDVVNQRLGYLVRSGDPDALDSIVPMAFGNLALDLVRRKEYGRLVSIHRGFYDSVPLASVTSEKKVVDVSKYYNTKRLRPIYQFDGAPLFIMTSDWKTPRPD